MIPRAPHRPTQTRARSTTRKYTKLLFRTLFIGEHANNDVAVLGPSMPETRPSLVRGAEKRLSRRQGAYPHEHQTCSFSDSLRVRRNQRPPESQGENYHREPYSRIRTAP